MPWHNYSDATIAEQTTFREVNPQLHPNYSSYMIWITKKGKVSRAKGQWQWTRTHAANVNAKMKAEMSGESVRTKGDLRDFKTATFHLDRYK